MLLFEIGIFFIFGILLGKLLSKNILQNIENSENLMIKRKLK